MAPYHDSFSRQISLNIIFFLKLVGVDETVLVLKAVLLIATESIVIFCYWNKIR